MTQDIFRENYHHRRLRRFKEGSLAHSAVLTMATRVEEDISKLFTRVPEEAQEGVFEAMSWAHNFLTKKEGAGHSIYVHGEDDGTHTCSFAKPEWAGDHCGARMPTQAMAVVRAVLEYEVGL